VAIAQQKPMVDGKSNLGGYEPFNEAHAIYSCAISLTFAPRSDRVARWPALLSIAQKTGRELNLGVPTPAYGLSLTFDPQRVSVSLNRPSPIGGESIGIEFATIDENGRVLDRFIASEDSLIVQTYAYIRWGPFFKRATMFFERMFDQYGPHTLAAIKAEYWDRFERRDSSIPGNLSLLVKPGSPYIAPSAFDPQELWHSHLGRFGGTDVGYRRLTNVHVDVVDAPLTIGSIGRIVAIYTMAQDSPDPGLPEGKLLALRSLPNALAAFERQHDLLKSILAQVISSEAASRIALLEE
jgi:hypothetical protein